jgi:hypothetical protein
MDQIIFVAAGTIVTVVYYILSPVKLSERVVGLLEKLSRSKSTGVAGKAQKARSYYVRHFK